MCCNYSIILELQLQNIHSEIRKIKQMKNIIILSIILLSQVVWVNAQTKIHGKVVNNTTKAGIAFVNIGVEGTFTGTASNADGEFELTIPANVQGKSVYFSAIGYELIKKTVAELNASPLIIKMQPQAYSLDGVDINAESRVIYRVLKKASQQIKANYYTGSFNYKFLFREEQYVNNKQIRMREADGDMLDETGYVRSNAANAYKKRHYRFTKAQRSFKPVHLTDGQNLMDDLLSFDIARIHGNILDTPFLNDYDLSLDKQKELNGKEVWVINYRLSKPDLARTGDAYAIKYGGRIYVAKSDYAILKNETWVSTNGKQLQGRSLLGKTNTITTDYKFITEYKKNTAGKYYLAHINYNRKGVDQKNNEQLLEIGSLLVKQIQPNPQNHFKGRVYFEKSR
ncbi:carboxypeptidase-like regulatory domain-containing protein [Prolixibacteraceae bacterium JC049]|nr:carboxypeptidase-like regulatory domain-containing protein [Prolixibacteraceae bacterium JC049]